MLLRCLVQVSIQPSKNDHIEKLIHRSPAHVWQRSILWYIFDGQALALDVHTKEGDREKTAGKRRG